MEQQNKIRVEVKYVLKFIPILILIHTPFGLKFFDWVAGTNAARIYARFNRYLMPLITVLAILLVIGGLMTVISSEPAREVSRDLGPRSIFLIPGLNPFLPWHYALISLFITIIIHEAGHGIVARVYNVKLESTGIVLFFVVPIGAFVNIERNELEKTPLKHKSAILTAGPLTNIILAGISLFGLYLVITTLSPLPISGAQEFGVSINGVNQGSLAEKIGLTEGSVIQTISGQNIRNNEDLRKLLQSNLGKTLEMTWYDKDKNIITRNIKLPNSVDENKGILGVTINQISDPKSVLDTYKSQFSINPLALLLPPTIQPGVVPYSGLMADKYDSSIFGSSYPLVANMLFWIWFINFNVAIFNALPIGPLDGGQWYGSLIASRTKEETGMAINQLITFAMIAIVLVVLFLPYIF
ncbi:MAG TPA: site-2 protease family protein [Nitrososphaeraceae archaeon]|nr:site-2 protease family protein [Nitrososphaeraceae archaeon]